MWLGCLAETKPAPSHAPCAPYVPGRDVGAAPPPTSCPPTRYPNGGRFLDADRGAQRLLSACCGRAGRLTGPVELASTLRPRLRSVSEPAVGRAARAVTGAGAVAVQPGTD